MWKARLEGAQSYSDWAEAAEQLDRIEGFLPSRIIINLRLIREASLEE